jgi:glutaredoxin
MNIIIYTKTGCPWSAEVMNLLNEKGIKFEERDMIKNPDFQKEVLEKTGQSKSPTLDIDGKMLPDTEAEEVKATLNL